MHAFKKLCFVCFTRNVNSSPCAAKRREMNVRQQHKNLAACRFQARMKHLVTLAYIVTLAQLSIMIYKGLYFCVSQHIVHQFAFQHCIVQQVTHTTQSINALQNKCCTRSCSGRDINSVVQKEKNVVKLALSEATSSIKGLMCMNICSIKQGELRAALK